MPGESLYLRTTAIFIKVVSAQFECSNINDLKQNKKNCDLLVGSYNKVDWQYEIRREGLNRLQPKCVLAKPHFVSYKISPSFFVFIELFSLHTNNLFITP